MYFLFNRTTLQVFVTYIIGALYVHPLWFYKHQHDSWVRSKLFVACQRWWFQWRFWFVPSVLGYLREQEEHKPDPWRNTIERNHMGLHLEKEVARRDVKTPTINFNNTVFVCKKNVYLFSSLSTSACSAGTRPVPSACKAFLPHSCWWLKWLIFIKKLLYINEIYLN